ncbi:hypothetical protein PXC01_06030 [Maribacter sp. M208]|uniref:hypothetical protein n=1 Tax=Maribacter huludaoensis TaxID=3030010 RepID=UPI0023EB4723|nr:hypothetical protein [Maribacter huludaoensis]MDF4221139.1 hypothetical protein [Maribacter huludaoensis]
MNFGKKAYLRTLIIICGILVQVSCAKDADLLSSYVVNDVVEDTGNVKPQNTIVLPSNFDWQNIPPEYANSVLEINEVFDLNDQTVELPMHVTLYFNEGHLENGTVEGDSTVITTEARDPIAEDVTFTGTYGNEYIMPHWFGAVMDGVTDDRDAFVETLAYADSLNLKVLIDRDMFLDVEETGKKSIFLEDNTWIEGADDARIIVNNILSPAFYIALSKGVTIKNITFLYDQTYIANYGEDYVGFENDFLLNLQQLRNYLRDYKEIDFNAIFPKDKGFVAFYAMFLLEAAEDVIFENVNYIAKGNTADTFIPLIIKMKEQYAANQIVSSILAPTTICRNIVLNNIMVDGAIMGFQGVVDGFHVDDVNSYRYSDFQDRNGNYLGGFDGVNFDFPPPHLFYLNKDTTVDTTVYTTKNVNIFNVNDYGNYVGNLAVRGNTGINIGYANSLKLTQQPENIHVENYKSYRRDGLGSLDGVKNGYFKNIYAESNIGLFNPSAKVSTLRLLLDHPLQNVTFENFTLKDIGESTQVMPLRPAYGSGLSLKNVNLYVNEFNGEFPACFGFYGDNNVIENASIHIATHSSSHTNRGIIFHDDYTMINGANNNYDIKVYGWRSIDNDPLGLSSRMLFAKPENSNSNYAKLHDITNNIIYEQKNELNTMTWLKTDTVNLGNGKTQNVPIILPRGFKIKRVGAKVIKVLDYGVKSISLGITNKMVDGLIPNLPISDFSSMYYNELNQSIPLVVDESITIHSDGDFNSKGSVRVDVELVIETNN